MHAAREPIGTFPLIASKPWFGALAGADCTASQTPGRKLPVDARWRLSRHHDEFMKEMRSTLDTGPTDLPILDSARGELLGQGLAFDVQRLDSRVEQTDDVAGEVAGEITA